MRKKLKKILFPFINNERHLDKFIWHRIFVVLYFFGLIFFFLWSWFAMMNVEYEPIESCIMLRLGTDINDCFTLSKVHHWIDLMIAFGLTIIISYLMQIIYYKIILYIIFGNKK